MNKDYTIKFEVVDDETDEVVVGGSAYLLPNSTESAELEFWKVVRGLDHHMKEEERMVEDLDDEEADMLRVNFDK
jgi:hypothetical protein